MNLKSKRSSDARYITEVYRRISLEFLDDEAICVIGCECLSLQEFECLSLASKRFGKWRSNVMRLAFQWDILLEGRWNGISLLQRSVHGLHSSLMETILLNVEFCPVISFLGEYMPFHYHRPNWMAPELMDPGFWFPSHAWAIQCGPSCVCCLSLAWDDLETGNGVWRHLEHETAYGGTWPTGCFVCDTLRNLECSSRTCYIKVKLYQKATRPDIAALQESWRRELRALV